MSDEFDRTDEARAAIAHDKFIRVYRWRETIPEQLVGPDGPEVHPESIAFELCAESYFVRELNGNAAGIIAVNSRGVWFYDGDGDIDAAVQWRPICLPWSNIAAISFKLAS